LPRPPPQAATEPPEVRAENAETTNGPGGNGESAERVARPDFDRIENTDQVQQREQFARFCTGLAVMPLPGQFLARHNGKLDPDHIEPARAAHQCLTAFLTAQSEPQPKPVVTWTLDGFLHKLVQVNTLMERHGVEIAELLANRISPGPDIAIVRAVLAHLSELDREFIERERVAKRER
jgi:hypothetical protein